MAFVVDTTAAAAKRSTVFFIPPFDFPKFIIHTYATCFATRKYAIWRDFNKDIEANAFNLCSFLCVCRIVNALITTRSPHSHTLRVNLLGCACSSSQSIWKLSTHIQWTRIDFCHQNRFVTKSCMCGGWRPQWFASIWLDLSIFAAPRSCKVWYIRWALWKRDFN